MRSEGIFRSKDIFGEWLFAHVIIPAPLLAGCLVILSHFIEMKLEVGNKFNGMKACGMLLGNWGIYAVVLGYPLGRVEVVTWAWRGGVKFARFHLKNQKCVSSNVHPSRDRCDHSCPRYTLNEG